MGKRYDEQFQLRASLQVVLQGMTYQVVSESLGPSIWSIREWVKKFRASGELQPVGEPRPEALPCRPPAIARSCHFRIHHVLEAGHSAQAKEKARGTVETFRKFIDDHRDELTALQTIYDQPYSRRHITYEMAKL